MLKAIYVTLLLFISKYVEREYRLTVSIRHVVV